MSLIENMTLNSNLILLIPVLSHHMAEEKPRFKFQSDSINTQDSTAVR